MPAFSFSFYVKALIGFKALYFLLLGFGFISFILCEMALVLNVFLTFYPHALKKKKFKKKTSIAIVITFGPWGVIKSY